MMNELSGYEPGLGGQPPADDSPGLGGIKSQWPILVHTSTKDRADRDLVLHCLVPSSEEDHRIYDAISKGIPLLLVRSDGVVVIFTSVVWGAHSRAMLRDMDSIIVAYRFLGKYMTVEGKPADKIRTEPACYRADISDWNVTIASSFAPLFRTLASSPLSGQSGPE